MCQQHLNWVTASAVSKRALTNQSTCSHKYVALKIINNIRHREEEYNFKKSSILPLFVSVTSTAQVRVLVVVAHTFKVQIRWANDRFLNCVVL